jgi:hypothetical protein
MMDRKRSGMLIRIAQHENLFCASADVHEQASKPFEAALIDERSHDHEPFDGSLRHPNEGFGRR